MLFKEYSINQFMDELISDAPSPGGGSTAALVVGLATGLNSMVYSLTIDKKSFDGLSEVEKDKMKQFQEKSKELNTIAQEFMDKDREDFVDLMSCYRLPKETEDEISFRKECIRKKTIKAMETPLRLAKVSIDFYENIEFAIDFGNKNLVSDAGVAAVLLHGAIESAIINVKVNLNAVRNEDFANEVEKECNEILMRSTEYKSKLVNIVEKRVYPK